MRTISQRRIGRDAYGVVGDPDIRAAVRLALAHHLGLDIPAPLDGAGEES